MSADDMRTRLSAEIPAANGGPLAKSLRKLRSACIAFVEAAGDNSKNFLNDPEDFARRLESLQDSFRPEVGWLAWAFDIEIEEHLARLIPAAELEQRS